MTDYKRGTYAAAGIIALLVVLCVLASLSGCLTPAKLAEMAQRADTLSRGAKTDECADAAANAASAVVVALGDMTRATKMSDPVRSPKSALRLAEVASLTGCKTGGLGEDCNRDGTCHGKLVRTSARRPRTNHEIHDAHDPIGLPNQPEPSKSKRSLGSGQDDS